MKTNVVVYVVMVLGYWGKGRTVADAATACLKAGAKRTDRTLLRIVHSTHYTVDELLAEISVNGCGDILYPDNETQIIRTFCPNDSKVKLSALLPLTGSKKGVE